MRRKLAAVLPWLCLALCVGAMAAWVCGFRGTRVAAVWWAWGGRQDGGPAPRWTLSAGSGGGGISLAAGTLQYDADRGRGPGPVR